jgi:potassium-dependent mechanosensitive channel
MFNCGCQDITLDAPSIAGAHRSSSGAMLLRRSILQNRRYPRIGWVFVLTILYGLFSLGAVPNAPAQVAPPPDAKISPSSPAAPTPGSTATLEAIPLNDIAKRLENSRRLLQETGERNEGIELAEIAREVEATRNSFTKETKAAEAAIAGSLRPEELSDIEISWKNQVSRVTKWQEAVSTQAGQLYKDLTLLEQEEQIWQLTLKTYAAGVLPRQVERAIRDHLGEIKKIKAELRKRLDQALVLENEIYQRETTITKILGDVALAKERFRDSLMIAERVPLWQIESEWQRMTLPAGGLAGLLSGQLADAITFVRAHLMVLGLFGLFLGVVLVVALLLSRKVARWTQDHPHFEEAASFLKRPVSLTLLVTLVAVLLLSAGNAPRLVLSLSAILLLVPLLRLLPPLIHPAARPPLYAVAGLYVFDSLRNLFLVIPILDRLSFLFADLVAITIALWLLRTARIRRLRAETPMPAHLVLACRLVVFILGVSVIANVLGYFDLARVLSTGTLYSVYAAFALFGTARALSILSEVLLDTEAAQSLSIARRYGKLISRRISTALKFASIILWLNLFLDFFSIKYLVLEPVTSFFTAPIAEGRINFSLWDIIAFCLVLTVAIVISRWVRILLEEDVFPRMRLNRGIPVMITTTVYYALLLLGFFFAMGMARVDLNRFTLLAGAFGVGVGFGLQNIVNNFISGLILLFERPIHPGDTVEVGGVSGVVKHIGIRSSTIGTNDGADAIIPNATLISEKLMNWTLTNPWRRNDIKIGIAYGSDLQQAIQILLTVAASDPSVLTEPAPAVVFQGFGESALNLELRVWTLVRSNVDTRSQVSIAMFRALSEAGIEVPVPQRDLRLRAADKSIEGLIGHGTVESGDTKGSNPRK